VLIFGSPLSSNAKCIACCIPLLEKDLSRNSNYLESFLYLHSAVGLSLRAHLD
jgi:hypothetical protein